MLPKIKRKLFDMAKMDPVEYRFSVPQSNDPKMIRQELINGYFDRQPTIVGKAALAAYFALRKVAKYTIKPLLRMVRK